MTSVAACLRRTLRVGWLPGIVAIIGLGSASSAWAQADPCNSSIPDCQVQIQAGISYHGWETQGWAYYCSGSHPYFWNYSFGNSCFEVTQNGPEEQNNPSKFDATITNWCLTTETIPVALACSDQVQPRPQPPPP